tara:strand:+ start:255 stop:539 length:285 start_codon:yes stop_codon:yes gene_type:complete
MASFKADSRYTRRVDVEDAQSDSHSDEYSDLEEIPKHMLREQKLWARLYEEELDELFGTYVRIGRTIFGSSFHQTGTQWDFTNFVFKYLQPGAN